MDSPKAQPSVIFVLFDVFGNLLRARTQPPLKRYPKQEVREYVPRPETCSTCTNRGQVCEVPFCKHWGHPIPNYNGTQFCSFHTIVEHEYSLGISSDRNAPSE